MMVSPLLTNREMYPTYYCLVSDKTRGTTAELSVDKINKQRVTSAPSVMTAYTVRAVALSAIPGPAQFSHVKW